MPKIYWFSRFTPRMSCRQLFGEIEDQFLGSNRICYENGDECNCTNFDMDWLSSSGNSCDDDVYDRYLKVTFSKLYFKKHSEIIDPFATNNYVSFLSSQLVLSSQKLILITAFYYLGPS